MKKLLSVAVLLAVSSFGIGCVSYPIVKPDAFRPTQKVAVISFDSEAITGGTLGMPLQVELSKPYKAFREDLSRSQVFDLIATEALQSSRIYNSVPPPPMDIGTAAPGLRRAFFNPSSYPELARELGADILVVVHHNPTVQPGIQVMGVGSSSVSVITQLTAYSADGQQIWTDVLNTSSDSFPNAGSVMDPNAVMNGALQASQLAARQLVGRLNAKLAAAPTP